jgi:DNA-directed RNA polymerase subunit H (RpoH/RPB5)
MEVALVHCATMLRRRGYTRDRARPPSKAATSKAATSKAATSKAATGVRYTRPNGDVLYVVENKSARVGVKELRDLVSLYKLEDLAHTTKALLIHTGIVSPFARREMVAKRCRVEMWLVEELQFDLLSHHLQPKMRALNKTEKATLLAQYSATHLPQLSRKDPVARHLGLTRGNVLRVERPHPTGAVEITFRRIC